MNAREIDIVFVTYNSSKWIDDCFGSYAQSLYPCEAIHVIAVDNGSTDDSLEKLENAKKSGTFASFDIMPMGRNLGFGAACNEGFAKGNSDIVCFFNIDTEIFPDTIAKLSEEIEATVNTETSDEGEKTAAWELRQFPYEHPKDYDILTGETDWCSAAAFAVRREAFLKVGGFDRRLFLYAEDVDLSFRLRSLGYKLKYCPKAVITHYAYTGADEVKPLQYSYSVVNNLLLRYRFGSHHDILRGWKDMRNTLRNEGPFKGSRKAVSKLLARQAKFMPAFFCWRMTGARKKKINIQFEGFDIYTRHRLGAFFELKRFPDHPLVSIVVRTHLRPNVLREALKCLRNQTYDNFEIVIVEDGEPSSQAMVESEFADLNIRYISTGEHVGRSAAGNIGMEAAKGEYINFLDDDDLFYADHIETLAQFLTETGMDAAYAVAFETDILVKSSEPYEYETVKVWTSYNQKFNRLLLIRANYIPIQTIMFKKKLFEEYGGIDTELDNQEDYDLWIRYALQTDFGYVEKTTSVFRIPAQLEGKKEREDKHWEGYERIREKIKQYELNTDAYTAGEEVIRIIEKCQRGERI